MPYSDGGGAGEGTDYLTYLEELEKTAWFYGLHPTETADWSPGELQGFIEAGRLREQRQAQFLYSHAALTNAAMNGKMPEIWEAFPLWSMEEIYQAKAERIARMLQRQAAAQG